LCRRVGDFADIIMGVIDDWGQHIFEFGRVVPAISFAYCIRLMMASSRCDACAANLQ
jgi:hypothetical protein